MWTTPAGKVVSISPEHIEKIRKYPENFRLLEIIPVGDANIPVKLQQDPGKMGTIIFLDTETTGFDSSSNDIIELGMVKCSYNLESHKIVSLDALFDQFDDPGYSIPPNITEVTRITNDMVSGCRIDEHFVREWLGDDPLIAAHNAAFDRPFFEKRFPGLSKYRWVCSLYDVDWKDLGYSYSKLPFLLEQEGWFYDAHRAHSDCIAVAWMLYHVPKALNMLLACERHVLKVEVFKAYSIKDDLKGRKYNWNNYNKSWYRTIYKSERDAEEKFLRTLGHNDYTITVHMATTRFKH